MEGITTSLESLKTVVSYFTTEFSTIVTTIASNPILLLPTGFFVLGGSIGIAKRLMR